MSALTTLKERVPALAKLATRTPKIVELAKRAEYRARASIRTRSVPLDRILLGGEWGFEGAYWSRLTGDLLRSSTPVTRGPHARLLDEYKARGAVVLEPETFELTDYYRNALTALTLTGRYFSARRPEQIRLVAKALVDRFEGRPPTEPLPPSVFSRSDHLPTVRKIAHSDCYEMIDGHHRAALAHARGETHLDVLVEQGASTTPLQDLLLDVLWTEGNRLLYQPVDSPELGADWTLVRGCSDRLRLMLDHLDETGTPRDGSQSYLDLGCSYGWFVANMAKAGFEARGVERDPHALAVGNLMYGNEPSATTRADVWQWLVDAAERGERTDVVSCFSVVHHFALGRGPCSAEELIRLVDSVTGEVLFFDTGQNHETWFTDSLSEWDADYVERWLLDNTTFNKVVRLGTDTDCRPPYADAYGRTLFACMRA